MVAKYPSIPEPTLQPSSMRDALLSVKQAFEVLTGQRGNHDYRAVLLPELTAEVKSTDADVANNTAAIAANTATISERTVAPDTSWKSFAYQNSWADYGAPFGPAGYRKLSSGLVVLKGLVQGGTAAGIATLPAGYRPGHQGLFNMQTNPNIACRIDIQTDGVILHNGGSNVWLALNGITFLAEL